MSRVNLRRAGQRDLDVRAQVAIADVLVKLRLAHDGLGLFPRAAQKQSASRRAQAVGEVLECAKAIASGSATRPTVTPASRSWPNAGQE